MRGMPPRPDPRILNRHGHTTIGFKPGQRAGKLSPFKFYQYLVGNVPDVDVVRFLKMLTFLPLERIEALEQAGAGLCSWP